MGHGGGNSWLTKNRGKIEMKMCLFNLGLALILVFSLLGCSNWHHAHGDNHMPCEHYNNVQSSLLEQGSPSRHSVFLLG